VGVGGLGALVEDCEGLQWAQGLVAGGEQTQSGHAEAGQSEH
jgi:hypothetical protein